MKNEAIIEIYSHEYNEYVVGYVLNTSKGDINLQFDKVFSNHPTPDFILKTGCEGDETADHLTDADQIEIGKYIDKHSEFAEIEQAFTTAMYNESGFDEKQAPIHKFEIFDAAEYEENDN